MVKDTPSYNDARLVSKAKNGDLFAFEQIVKNYQGRLIAFAFRILRDENATEDVVQDTFVAFYKNLDRFDTNYKLSSYLYEIAKNKALSYIRKNGRITSLERFPDIPANVDLVHNLDIKNRFNLLKSAFTKLDPMYRKILSLRYIIGLSVADISKKLSIPVATTKTKIRRGKIALVKEMKNEK